MSEGARLSIVDVVAAALHEAADGFDGGIGPADCRVLALIAIKTIREAEIQARYDPMTNPLHLAAKAHYEAKAARFNHPRLGIAALSWDDLPEDYRLGEIEAMRAALLAIRKPNDAVTRAVNLTMTLYCMRDDPLVSIGKGWAIYEAVIDALLDGDEANAKILTDIGETAKINEAAK